MTGIEVKVKSIDHSSPYEYPSRTLEVRTAQGNITTPLRAATYYEYNAKMKVPTAVPIDSPVLINIKKMTRGDLTNFLTKNETFGQLLRRIQLSNRIGQYARMRLVMLQPTSTSYRKDEPTAMDLLRQSVRTRDRFLRFVIRIQEEAGFDTIVIPFLELEFRELRSLISEVHKSLTNRAIEPMFFVDLRYASFGPLVELLVKKLDSKLIGLIYRPYAAYPVHYDSLRQYHDKDVLFFAAQTRRYDSNYDDISTMHYLPFFGNDMYAVRIPPPPFYDEFERAEASKDTGEIPKLDKIRFFDRESLKIKPLGSAATDEQILGDLRYEDQEIVESMLRNRSEVNLDNNKFVALNSFSKVHELNTSLLEFEDLRRYIDEDSTKEYVKEKSSLRPVLSQIEKKKTLNDFT